MEFKNTVNRDDFITFAKLSKDIALSVNNQKNKTFFTDIVAWVIFAIGVQSLYYIFTENPGMDFSLPAITLTAFSLCAIALMLSRWAQQKNYLNIITSEPGTFMGEMIYRINDDGIVVSSSNHRGIHPWHGIKRIEFIDDTYFLFTDYIYAIILPLRNLDDETRNHVTEMIGQHGKAQNI